MSALLEVDGLRKVYPVGGPSLLGRLRGEHGSFLHAVDGVSFTIGEGESVGLVGESGCGKSTLVRLLSRLIDPSEGTIRLAGQNLADIPAARFGTHAARRDVQVVFQDPHESLNPRFTAFHCIADPLLRLERMTSEPLKARVQELASLVGLPAELLTRYPHQLSGGQKARVNIARAVAVNPRLLILDEPTSALDVSVQAVILHLLADLQRRLGMSYLFVSHDLNVVRLLCDRVMVMYLGQLVEAGPVEEIFARPAHPYTQALMSAIPQQDDAARPERIRLAGEPQSPIDPPPQRCRFASRCPHVHAACETLTPTLQILGKAHTASCHLLSPAAERAA